MVTQRKPAFIREMGLNRWTLRGPRRGCVLP